MGNTKRTCTANPVPCGCWRGRGHVRPQDRRQGRGPGEHGDPRAMAPARRHGEAGVPPTCCRAGSRRMTSSSPRATGRGGAIYGRAADTRGGRGAFRAGAGTVPQGCPGLRGRDVSLPTSASRDPQP